VHPDADGQQNHGGEQRAETFGQFPACAADAYEKGCNSPGQRSCKGRNPTDVDMTNHLAAIGLAQKGDHGDHDQQRFHAFAQQDGERAEEGGRRAGGIGRQHLLGIAEQPIEDGHAILDRAYRFTAADGGAKMPISPRYAPSVSRHAASAGSTGSKPSR
jgi:hypothetical protein